MNFKVFSALFFALILLLGFLLGIYRMILIIQEHKKLKKYSIDDFFMAFIYGIFTLRYSVMKKNALYQKTNGWMKMIYLMIVIALVLGVFAYQ